MPAPQENLRDFLNENQNKLLNEFLANLKKIDGSTGALEKLLNTNTATPKELQSAKKTLDESVDQYMLKIINDSKSLPKKIQMDLFQQSKAMLGKYHTLPDLPKDKTALASFKENLSLFAKTVKKMISSFVAPTTGKSSSQTWQKNAIEKAAKRPAEAEKRAAERIEQRQLQERGLVGKPSQNW